MIRLTFVLIEIVALIASAAIILSEIEFTIAGLVICLIMLAILMHSLQLEEKHRENGSK